MSSLPKSLRPAIEEIARTAESLYQRGWAERNAGNLSWRVDVRRHIGHDREALLITARNSRMRDIARDPYSGLLLLSVDIASGDSRIVAGQGEPTSELATHLRLHRLLKLRHAQNRVLLHTHPRYLTAITHHPDFRDENAINALLRAMHPEISLFLWEGVGWSPFRCPGSAELAEVAESALIDHSVALLDRHGVMAVGETPSGALDRIELAERAVETWFLCQTAGFAPIGLSQNEIDLVAQNPEGK